MTNYEVGYTPTNLRTVRQFLGWTQLEAANFHGVGLSTYKAWEVEDLDKKAHSDMPLKKWRIMFALLATTDSV